MLIGEIIGGNLLPWLLFAPAIPLFLILIKGNIQFRVITVLAILCTVTLLSNLFVTLAFGSELQPVFLRVSFLLELVFTGLLLKQCTTHQILKYSILTSLLVFASIYLSFMSLAPSGEWWWLMLSGGCLLFLSSILVLLSKLRIVELNLLRHPDFWFAGGIFFHFGLLSLLLLSRTSGTHERFFGDSIYSLLHAIIFFIQFLFFTTGVIVQRTWDRKSN